MTICRLISGGIGPVKMIDPFFADDDPETAFVFGNVSDSNAGFKAVELFHGANIMAQIKRRGEQKYLIRVSKGTGENRQFINKTFRGPLAEARAFARELETAIDKGNISEFKERLLDALEDPAIRQAIAAAMRQERQPATGLSLVKAAGTGKQ